MYVSHHKSLIFVQTEALSDKLMSSEISMKEVDLCAVRFIYFWPITWTDLI
jgi:hypothetical protein